MALLVALFIVVPIVELYVIIQVGQAIGVVPTLLLLFADAVLGSLLLRHQGRGAWRRFNEALAQRRFPGREVADGAMIVVGGTLLLTPGFITDIFGLLLLIPPTRAILRRLLRSFFGRRFLVVGLGDRAMRSGGPTRGYDYDGTAEEVDAEDPRLGR
ncbi:MAG TPA: FxsA family protein [Solirubrobacterales bacterium]